MLLVDDAELGPVVIEARDALRKFVAGMGTQPAPPRWRSALADRPSMAVNFTRSDIAIDRSLSRLFSRPGSGSLDARRHHRRHQGAEEGQGAAAGMVVFVNDASAEFSDRLHGHVADALKEIGASLWTVELQTSSPPQNLPARERAAVVGDVTGMSGGVDEPVLSPQGLVKAFADLSAAMTSKSFLTYGSPDPSNFPPSNLAVELRDKTMRLTSSRWPTP